MSGAYANIVQLCRAHYEADESTFAAAANTLDRGSKVSSFRFEIERIVREGRARAESRKRDQWNQGRRQDPQPFGEVAAYADDLAQLIDRGASTEAEFDGVKKAWKGKIDDIKREIMATSTKVREHKELRLVKCVRELDFGAGEVREARTDTGEILGTRPISDTERQKELDFDGDVEDEFDDDAAEDGEAAE